MVKGDCPNIVQVSVEREEAPPCLVRPHLDLVIITPGHKEWLCFVEINPANRAIVLFKTVDQSTHSVVP